ncbi:bifunctional DNA-formamidopyrimidine glycosylase/DNA-(apurinic or apyrimidinic site) lyase [Thalassotalea profundi]|uniref:Formamidopyrimidine-DNA glycosylase n=1 Tax=Thalassotalea profundi TaxID=2036687 RepID=A0ABQ3J285_9GAMM|nr:bifunctional DNA-formamidopyrimidine glycosylase/DNA-(apurinic or apyrimidinic site) lyase [Thalassotalea profundi]GHE97107.1 formamidopyrimidine-DNA glycosylase [Thalassotalea profundi]
MPELPEVEVCRQGISPHLCGNTVTDVIIRHKQLRWPVSDEINKIKGDNLLSVERRSKYLLLRFKQGTLVIHLGMSGTIRVLDGFPEIKKHDHFDLMFSNNKCLRFNDPRRFGAILWFDQHVDKQGLLAKLGPEPLSEGFSMGYLFDKAKNKKVAVKTFIMNSHIVVGVGNIYANEALFLAGILPLTPVNKITKARFDKLTQIIKEVLAAAIKQGGTTLKDFTQTDGKPGYFAQKLNVYGRAGKKCVVCETILEEIRQSNRSSVFCPNCQG